MERPSGKNCVILGGAEGVYDEWERAKSLGRIDAVFGVNDIATREDVTMCTLHPRQFAVSKRGYCISYSRDRAPMVDEVISYIWKDEEGKPLHGNSGSSGLYAVKVALELGFERIVLCGVHIDRGLNIFSGKEWYEVVLFKDVWTKVLPQIEGKVHSYGGWTKQLLNPRSDPPAFE